eukprot:236614-Amorphochlora_amoeboformis.AAC.1
MSRKASENFCCPTERPISVASSDNVFSKTYDNSLKLMNCASFLFIPTFVRIKSFSHGRAKPMSHSQHSAHPIGHLEQLGHVPGSHFHDNIPFIPFRCPYIEKSFSFIGDWRVRIESILISLVG